MQFNHSLPEIPTKTLAVKLSAAGERSVRNHHPWLFSESILKLNKEGNAGDVAVIFGHKKNKVLGVGLYDPNSPIRIKMLHFDSGTRLDEEFFQLKIQAAFDKRDTLLQTDTNSYRLLFGENDGLPGCIADVYADVLVLKLYSEIWYPYLQLILTELISISKVNTAVIRLSRNLQKNDSHNIIDGLVIYGSLQDETIVFHEHGIQFSANVIKGHKTGYFLDHRENRRRIGAMSNGKSILDVFSYTGGFSVHALANGAKEVTSVDISEQALEVAKFNASLNEHSGKHVCLKGDAFEVLAQLISEKKTFDIVVIDPPSFAKSKKEIPGARKKYSELASLGITLTATRGTLVLASCSSRITSEKFFQINESVLNESGRKYAIKNFTYHDVDHPVGFKEGAYLKCGYYSLD